MTGIAFAALWFFVFAVPWENVLIIPGVGTISRLIGIIAFGLVLLHVVGTTRVRKLEAFHVIALIFVLWACAGAFWATDPGRMNLKVQRFIQLLLMIWMLWELATTPQRQRALLMAYVFGAYVAAYKTFGVYYSELGTTNVRFSAPNFDPNDLGMLLALAIPMAWYLGSTLEQPLLRWASRLYIPVGLVAIGLTASRGALLASIVGLCIIPFTLRRISKGLIIASIPLALLSVYLMVSFVPQSSWQRFSTTGTEVTEGSLNERRDIWMAGLQTVQRHPLQGTGPGGFDNSVAPILGSDHAAHNAFLSVLVEEGLIGLFLFLAMLGIVFVRMWTLPHLEQRFQLILIMALVVAMLPLTWEDRKPVWFILGFMVAQSASMRLVRESTSFRHAFIPRRAPAIRDLAGAGPVRVDPTPRT
jgi:O-antigen ligase